MLKWITVDEKYLDYLRTNVDSRIPNTNYGQNKLKPFFGVLFETENFAYVSQVSHPQDRHQHQKATMTFLKVFHNDTLICVINLNYMFPIPMDKISEMHYKDIEQYRIFATPKAKTDYVALLKKEMSIMQTMNIEKKAYKLYSLCKKHPETPVAKSCISFSALETACMNYYNQQPSA